MTGTAAPTVERPKTVYVIRHAEKPPIGNGDLGLVWPKGWARAAMLAREAADLFPGLGFVFASRPWEKSPSRREIETAMPIARATGSKLDCTFPEDLEGALGEKILGDPGTYGGRVILIVWHHSQIPVVLTALGAHPKEVPAVKQDEWDGIWQLTYDPGATVPLLEYRAQPEITKADYDASAELRNEFGNASCWRASSA